MNILIKEENMELKSLEIKEDIEQLYDQLGTKKHFEIDSWLKTGDKVNIPETKSGNYFINRKLQTALKLAKLDKGAKILEIGCQYGYFTFRLANLGFNVTAIDLSNKAIEIAKRRADYYGISNINFMKGDAEALDNIENNVFDAVFSFSCLRYLSDPTKALSEIYRVLKPSGKIVADFPNKFSPWFNLIKPIIGVKPHVHDNLYSTFQVKSFVSSARYKSIKTKKILFTPRRIPSGLLPFFKITDILGERIYGFREFATIIFCYGEK